MWSNIEIESDGKVISRIQTLGKIEEVSDTFRANDSVYIICDGNVSDLAARVSAALEARAKGTFLLDATEENKSINTVRAIQEWLLGLGADRKSMILGIGGGITTDLAGFAASIYKRGIKFSFVPTTLLAQVDAAIGGKNGVNFRDYKNMVGTISQPEYTFEIAECLETLPQRDFLSGAAELLKTFIIEDGGNYRKAVEFLTVLKKDFASQHPNSPKNTTPTHKPGLSRANPELSDLIHVAASVKAGVVSRDQFENGERRKLNLGHTFAHAIEHEARLRKDDITHGEAVAMGIVLAARLSDKTGLSNGLEMKITEDFAVCGLPVACPYSMEELTAAMDNDKKAEGGSIHFILPAAIGDVRIVDMTADTVLKTLQSRI